jgi:hypothetical protein
MIDKLKKLKACEDGLLWINNKSSQEVYDTLDRGDWLLWFFKKANPDDVKLTTLVKGYCANTVRHLMKDQRSTHAVDMAIAFGEGKATLEELIDACDSAYECAEEIGEQNEKDFENRDESAYSAAYSAYSASDINADGAATAAYASEASEDKDKNLKETADIVRKHLPLNIWNL